MAAKKKKRSKKTKAQRDAIQLAREKAIREAQLFARAAHAGQTRDDGETPHYVHVTRVGYRVARFKDVPDPYVQAAILHDTVEDTAVTLADISTEFGPVVAEVVDWLTDEFTKDKYPDLNRLTRKQHEAHRLGRAPRLVRMIKMLDRIDNLRDLKVQDAGFVSVYLRESEDLLRCLIAIGEEDPLPKSLIEEYREAMHAGRRAIGADAADAVADLDPEPEPEMTA